ncbi:MAG: ABC transporter ATP-binding protein [Gemmatimonadetes bacterium]|nr:ABC transporter ATP-binding protein [Gemmatimonadota bacterium]
MSENGGPVLRAEGLEKSYPGTDGTELSVLRGVDLSVQPGEAVAVVGASGSGKSTLLHLLGALDRPTHGEVYLGGRAVSDLDPDQVADVRNRYAGFVFQFHHLLREFTARENVMMPAMIAGTPLAVAAENAMELLHAVGLADRAHHKPGELSGGEQQRVAVARALSNDPVMLLADEPSGNLDRQTSEQLHDLLFELRGGRNLAMVLVTHNVELAQRTDRVLRLEDGRLHAAGGH